MDMAVRAESSGLVFAKFPRAMPSQPSARAAEKDLSEFGSAAVTSAPAALKAQGQRWQEWGCILAICAPVLGLLLVPGREFGLDWPGHMWMTAYFGEYFRHHLAFPEVLNTDWISGMPYPVFYGFLFFPVAGLLSIPLGADVAVRLIVAGVMIMQCRQTWRLMTAAGAPHRLGWIVAAVFCWSTYSLTNLYNRGALPEFIAVALLLCALSCFLRALMDPTGTASRRDRVAAFFYYALCAGTHPLTAVFGSILIATIVLSALPFLRRALWSTTLRWGVLGILGTVLVLSPWIYATSKFHKDLAIHQDSMTQVMHFTESVDQWGVRFSPLPTDGGQAAASDTNRAATPHLDAQLNTPLFLLALVVSLGIACARTLRLRQSVGLAWAVSAASLAIFMVALLASLSPAFFNHLPGFCHSLQFAYRLVAYQNLALVAMIAGLVHLDRLAGPHQAAFWKRPLFQGALLLLGLVGLLFKMSHAATAMKEPGPDGRQWRQATEHLVHLPFEFYGWPAYGTPGSSPEQSQPAEPVFLEVGTGATFGRVAPVIFILEQTQERVIQVQPFPWSRVFDNGQPLAPGQVRALRQGLAVTLPPGTHEISWHWEPDRVWTWLRMVSFLTLGGWLIGTLAFRFQISNFRSQI